MIEWREVARDDTGLNLYRIDAEMGHPVSPGQGRFDPMRGILSRYSTDQTKKLDANFSESGAQYE